MHLYDENEDIVWYYNIDCNDFSAMYKTDYIATRHELVVDEDLIGRGSTVEKAVQSVKFKVGLKKHAEETATKDSWDDINTRCW